MVSINKQHFSCSVRNESSVYVLCGFWREENHMHDKIKKKSEIKNCKRWTYLLGRIITCSSAVWRWRVYAYGSRDEEDEAVLLVNKQGNSKGNKN
jgi:hypothetical protein